MATGMGSAKSESSLSAVRTWVCVAAAALGMSIICGCGFSGSHLTAGKPIGLAQFNSLRLGESRTQVMKQFGLPESRQRLVPYGFTHEEPKGKRCIYYRRRFPDAGDPWDSSDTFQLCFSASRLRYKWAYIAARA
jgi:hypothetical protein